MELVTDRLHLRPARVEDRGDAVALGADERAMEWLSGAASKTDARGVPTLAGPLVEYADRVKRILKRVAMVLGSVVLLLVVAAAVVYWTAFGHNRPLVDRQVLAPGVTIVKDGFVSVAMLDVGPDEVALVDCGNDKRAKTTIAALADRKLTPTSVVAIFLTHGHPDHTAGCRVFPSAEVYAMQDEVALIGNAAEVKHPLKDGDVAQIGALRVEAFATPGHTAGSAVYFARGVLFFGDSAGGAKDGTMMPAVRLFSKDPDRNVSSLKSLEARLQSRAAEVNTLAFAHTGPLDGFAPFEAFASPH
jgi:glyoxylase-like metal-dependent hydrolase (beta-lactamase superfamily II)